MRLMSGPELRLKLTRSPQLDPPIANDLKRRAEVVQHVPPVQALLPPPTIGCCLMDRATGGRASLQIIRCNKSKSGPKNLTRVRNFGSMSRHTAPHTMRIHQG
eukprot:CAMPEP_0115474060 /NCGR_PEP_ID=MMETSP0271-20121206/53900_1 /TAXON_ID=71861 /ORGANISM="Scrippsiella trochoidea, Strain CCMP3099" /LENGTH=102 /DNA_ID=CAMNT_0002901377 /DNA_START=8 /DNA_END=317 /DNA_ORIENTATION=+